MKLSIQRLRWFLIAAAVLLIVVLAAYIGYGRYVALNAYRRILARSGAAITHDTNGFTYSQSVQGKTIFTLHAKKATQLGEGRWSLHDAEMTLYGRMEGREDHIYSSEIEYNETEGVARARGEVQMDLEAPESLTGGHQAGPAADPAAAEVKAETAQVIHVRTSGLVYLRKLGVAATEQQTEFRYGSLVGTSQGAEFNTNQSTLNLLADVVMDGEVHGRPVHVTALKADMDRTANMASFTGPVMASEGRTASAQQAVIGLRKDGSIESVQGLGGVVLTSGTQQVAAQRLDATLSAQSVPQTAMLSGGVVLTDTDILRPMHGSADRVSALFTAQGAVRTATANGAARLEELDRRRDAKGLRRSLAGATIVASFAPDAQKGARRQAMKLSGIQATGGAKGLSDSVDGAAQRKTLQVAGDDLRLVLAPGDDGRPEPQRLFGNGHTLLQQDAALGEQETSTGETLEATFAPGSAGGKDSISVRSAVQTGGVTIHDRAAAKPSASDPKSMEPGAVSTGTAERASYDGPTQRLTLTGDAHLYGNDASLIAPAAWIDQRTQDAGASGGVRAVMQGAQARPSAQAPLTHVLAASAHLQHATRVLEFRGTDADPAKMWQDGSQVQAAVLVFDGLKHTVSARPVAGGTMIHAVFAGSARTDSAKTGAAAIVRVASPKMDYNDVQHEATFWSGVLLDGTMGEVRGDRAVVFLQPAARGDAAKTGPASAPQSVGGFQGSLERVVVSGDVRMEQPGRHGRGEQLLYTAAKDDYVLTGAPGEPPRIVDDQQGTVTGTTLLFGDAGSTIVVAGDADKRSTTGRVRTETEVRQQ
jgi:lipopolysaccharide export system protein LptA